MIGTTEESSYPSYAKKHKTFHHMLHSRVAVYFTHCTFISLFTPPPLIYLGITFLSRLTNKRMEIKKTLKNSGNKLWDM